MTKALITGVAGSIGYHIAKEILKNTDWDIVGIDSFRHRGYHERIRSLMEEVGSDRIKILNHDLVCPINDKLASEIGEVDHIIHLAAISDVFWGQENPTYTLKNNIDSTIVMCEYAKKTPHKTFNYFSTDEVYGPVQFGGAHPEWDTHRPSNFYSASKAASEDICYAYWRNGDIKLIITNTMNNFGQWQSDAKFPVKIQRALENGEKVIIHGNEKEVGTRHYIHSKRVAHALIKILEKGAHDHVTGEIDDPHKYHLVGHAHLSNLALARRIAELMGKELDYELVDFHRDNPAHDIHYGLENNKININDNFDEDMKEVIEWQGENK